MEKDKILKRVLYRAAYRGGKEADRLLGGFAQEYAPSLSLQDLQDLDHLLQQDDEVIFSWIDEQSPVPPTFTTPLLNRLRGYIHALKS